MPLRSLMSENGDVFYMDGDIFKTSEITLTKRLQLLMKVTHTKFNNLADVLNMSPQQLSYKIHHHLSIKDIKIIAMYLGLNNNQIVNIFIK